MEDYYDLLKGSGGAKSINQHDGFGDLLGECRVSAKEDVDETIGIGCSRCGSTDVWHVEGDVYECNKCGLRWNEETGETVEESKVNEEQQPFTKQEIQHAIDDIKDRIADAEPDDYEDTESYDSAISEWEMGIENLEDEMLDAPDEAEFESKVNELDEPDLERPEKARRRPKKKRPVRPEPEVDRIPKEEPEPEEPRPDDTIKEEPPEKDPDEVPEIGEPDRDEVPPPPEELREPEQPIEMRKEYLGRSKETHFYFITTEGEGGVVADFVIADQEGVKKYSAKDKDIDVSEENIAEFLIQAYRDMDIAQIERSIFMKYLYPEIIKRGPEEEMVEEPGVEDEFGKEKKPLETGGDEEELPRESKKIKVNEKQFIVNYITAGGGHREVTVGAPSEEEVESILKDAVGYNNVRKIVSIEVKESKNLIEMKVTDESGNEFDVHLVDVNTTGATIDINGREFRLSSRLVSKWQDARGSISEVGLRELALDALETLEQDEYRELFVRNHERVEKAKANKDKEVEESYLIEMKVVDGIGNEFEVNLAADGTIETVIDINGRNFTFSPEFASMWRDETGAISEEGLEELALDALAMMEEDEYQELVAKNQEGAEGERTTDLPVGAEEGSIDPDKEAETQPEHELEDTGGIDEPTDDVDMSKGDIHRQLKYRPKEEPVEGTEMSQEEIQQKIDWLRSQKPSPDKRINQIRQDQIKHYEQKLSKPTEGKNQPGVRDGTGPAKGSYQRKIKGGGGKRKEAGEGCTYETKENENIEGDSDMDKKLSEFTNEQLINELAARKEKTEGIDPKKEDSEDTKIKKLAEDGEVKEEKIDETDVAKGAKALVQLLKDAVKAGDYAKAAEYATKAAEIEAMVPAEAEAEANKDGAPDKKDDKEDKEPAKKDDKEDKKPEKKEEPEEKPEEELDKKGGADEKKKPPVCDKCGKAHWPFDKCSETVDVDEAKDKKDKEAKAKKEKAEKDAKVKKDKEEKAKKDKEAKAKKAKAKKESKIPVEDTEDITERKGLNLLNELLGIK